MDRAGSGLQSWGVSFASKWASSAQREKKKRYVEIMKLHCCDDVKRARSETERVFVQVQVALLYAKDNGGDWDEQRIAELAVRAVNGELR